MRLRTPRFREMRPYNQRRWLAVLVAAAMVVQLSLVIRLLFAIAMGHQPHDFIAYDSAVRHLLAGEPLYDTSATATGGLGLFLYPPSFALLLLPIALLPTQLAASIWMVLLVVIGVIAVWLMPVSRVIRWLLTLMLGLSYPFIDALAQGQVGPVLLLLFALAWRSIGWPDTSRVERPTIQGIALGLGATIKIQPVLAIGWALLTRRFRAAVIAIGLAGALAIIATIAVGPGAWADLATVLANTNQPTSTEHSVGIARVAFELGASTEVAYGLYVATLVAVVAALLAAVRWGSATSSFLVAAVGSQLLSPVVWAHYAVVLILPVAWLMSRSRWWAILLLVATSIPFSDAAPPITYPLVFWLAILAVLREGVLEAREGLAIPAERITRVAGPAAAPPARPPRDVA